MRIEFKSAPQHGKLLPVCEGIEWACMPLPFALDHVNCWVLSGADQQLVIDTGVDNTITREQWALIFGQKPGWPSQLLVTHFHPDHTGLAGWFRHQGCSTLIGSEYETRIVEKLWYSEAHEYADIYEKWYRTNGLPDDTVQAVQANGNSYRKKVHQPPDSTHWTFVEDGQILNLVGREYTVMKGQGHAPDMIMLYRHDDHVLIAADQVLPFISPNVSVMPRLEATNPLALFLSTLTRLHDLPDDTLVLPSHGLPFRGLHQRLTELHQHHDLRLDEVLVACKEPQSAYDLFAVLYRRKLDAQQTSFALGEALAHLHYLEDQGKIQRIDDASVTRFCSV